MYRPPPPEISLSVCCEYIEGLPAADAPELFGMNQNADTAFLAGRGRALIADLLAAQPRLTTSIGYDWNIFVATFSNLNELKKKSGGAYAQARAQLRTLLSFLFFNFRRTLIGYSNGLNFNDVICLVACTKWSGFGIFESNWTCLVPSVFIGFYGFYGFCGLSGKPSEQSFLICIKKKNRKRKNSQNEESCWHWERESSD